MKMKLIIFGILCVTVIQAHPSWEPSSDEERASSPSSDPTPKKKVKICEDRLEAYRSKVDTVKKLYDDYYGEYKKLEVKAANPVNLRIVESEHDQFERNMTAFSDRYAEDSEKISHMRVGHERQAFCLKERHWFYSLTINLTKIATKVKSDVPLILNQIGVPKNVVDNFDKLLSRTVNCLFLIHLGTNLFKEAVPFIKKVFKLTDDKVELEKEWKFGSDRVEPVEEVVAPDYEDNFNGDDNKMDNEIQKNFNELEDNTKVETAEKSAKEELIEELEEERNEIGEGEAEIFDEPLISM